MRRIALGVTLGVGALLACLAIGVVSIRLDAARSEARAAVRDVARLRAELAAVEPPPVVPMERIELTERRVEVLRRTMSTLIERGVHWHGTVSMPSLDDALWPAWPPRGYDLRCERSTIVGGEPVP